MIKVTGGGFLSRGVKFSGLDGELGSRSSLCD